MAKKQTFGGFVKSKRMSKHITQKQIADVLGVSTVYISDIENNRRYPPTNGGQLQKLAECLQLQIDEQPQFYDLAAFSKKCVSPDLSDYIMSSEIVRTALRKARNKASERDWLDFIEAID